MSNQCTFSLPSHIEYQPGGIKNIANIIENTLKSKRIFLITDPGIIKAGIVSPIVENLSNQGYVVEVFDQVKPNPKDIDCEKGGALIKKFGADMIVAIGGGSVLDAAKAIALLHTHEGRLGQYEGRNRTVRDITPIVAIPTTAGTGSEVTRSAVITDTKRKFKMTVKDIRMAPKIAIVDPEITYSLPRALTASTGMDAFVHAIEAFTCKVATPFSDAWAKEAMRYIFPNLRAAVLEGTKEARNKMMIGSVMAGVAFSHADVAAVHCLAEALGGLYDTPHGVANSIFLPYITEYNVPANPARHAEAAHICGLPVSGLSEQAAAELLISELRRLSRDIGIPAFKDIEGVSITDFDRLAEASLINGSTPDNCRDIGKTEYLEILNKAYHDA